MYKDTNNNLSVYKKKNINIYIYIYRQLLSSTFNFGRGGEEGGGRRGKGIKIQEKDKERMDWHVNKWGV